jgi:hypothetical protein
MLLAGCLGAEETAAAARVPVMQTNVSDTRAATPGSDESIDVIDTPATIEGNRVSTACFAFTAPDIGEPWVLSPYASNCQTEVNWSTGDMLTRIIVKVQTGDTSVAEMEASFTDAGFQMLESVDKEVNGQAAHVYQYLDLYGLMGSAVVIDLPPGRFHANGEPVTDLFIAGSTHSEGLMAVFEELVFSIEIH